LKRVVPEGTIFGGDIGCNMMGTLPPHNMYDYLFDMGAGLGISHGVKKSTNQKVVSIMGDGTFFHSGIAPLINVVYNKSNPVVVILDNRITAMTGHQTNPGMGKTSMGEDTVELSIEEIVKACGVKNVKTIDNPSGAESMKELESTVKEFLNKEEVSVIIYKRICALLARRQAKQ
jgi:indolepyruvate ferredoxin oxidoreductase alpha subunit